MGSGREDTAATGTIIGGKFRVVRVLGAGGMGAVYEVEHLLTHHRRALKLLHKAAAAHAPVVERFLREASAAGRIADPHIVETFDAGTLDTGEPYLVMELVTGEELSRLLAREKQLPVGRLAALVRQACRGVQAAHDAGIVHRDLKPDNLLITEREGSPFVKILDFGISKFAATNTTDAGLTREGALMGTPYYMPPEQVRGAKDLDGRADVYALGVILYEGATGRKPFLADTLEHLAVLIHEGRTTPLGTVRPDLPPEFCRVVERAMSTDPSRRFASPRELAAALEPFEGSAERSLAEQAGAAAALSASIDREALGLPPTDAATRRTRLMIGGSAALVVALLAAFGLTRRDEGATTPTAEVGASTPSAPLVRPSAAEAGTEVAAERLTPLPSADPTDANARVVPPGRETPKSAPVGAPSVAASSRGPTKAEQSGLANENPYPQPRGSR